MFGTGVEKLIIESFRRARFSGHCAEGFMAAGLAAWGRFHAHYVNFFSASRVYDAVLDGVA